MEHSSKLLETGLALLYRWKTGATVSAVLIFGAALFFATQISLNDAPERWFPRSTVANWQRFRDHFADNQTIALGVHFRRSVRDEDALWLKRLREELEAIDGVARVMDVSLIADIEGVTVTDLVAAPDNPQSDPFAMYRGVVYDDPTRLPGDQSTQGRTMLTVIELADSSEDRDTFRRRMSTDVHKVVEAHQREDREFHLLGATVIQDALEKSARKAVLIYIPAFIGICLLSLGCGFRSLAAAAIGLFGGLWGITVMIGGIALAGWTLNVVTVSAPPMMAVIAIATTVHFAHHCSTLRRRTAQSGDHEQDEPRAFQPETFVGPVVVPCLGAALATGIGFLTLTFNELQPARELGFELFAGALLSFLGVYMISWWLIPFPAAAGLVLAPAYLQRLARVCVARPRWMLAVSGLVIVACFVTAVRLPVDADPFAFFRSTTPVGRALQHFNSRGFGFHALNVVLVPRNRPDNTIARLAAGWTDRSVAQRFEQQIRDQPEVRNVISSTAIQERAANLQTLLADVRRAWAFWDFFRNWAVDHQDRGAIRITFMVRDQGAGFHQLIARVREALPREHFDCFFTGSAADMVVLSDGLVGGISRGLTLALLATAVLCQLLFRSMRLTMIAFLPNAFPMLLVFGAMGVLGIPLNTGSAMVATIALGIAVNDTVHFMLHYRECRRHGLDVDTAVERTFVEVGRPIILTSIVTCLGFSVFLLSDFQPIFHFGLLAGLAMLAALGGDLLLLPSLLRLFDRRGRNAD